MPSVVEWSRRWWMAGKQSIQNGLLVVWVHLPKQISREDMHDRWCCGIIIFFWKCFCQAYATIILFRGSHRTENRKIRFACVRMLQKDVQSSKDLYTLEVVVVKKEGNKMMKGLTDSDAKENSPRSRFLGTLSFFRNRKWPLCLFWMDIAKGLLGATVGTTSQIPNEWFESQVKPHRPRIVWQATNSKLEPIDHNHNSQTVSVWIDYNLLQPWSEWITDLTCHWE